MLTAHAKAILARCGLSVRTLGRPNQARGVNFWHDANAILGDPPVVTVFDVGANVGQTIAECFQHIPCATITAFEPGPEALTTLRSRYGTHPRVRIEAAALGDTQGAAELRQFDDNTLSSFLNSTDILMERGTVTVPVVTLDDYCQSRHIDRVDILKIDTQGFDLHVLRGASNLLSRRAVRILRMEVNMRSYYAGQPDLLDLLNTTRDIGYKPLAFYDTFFLDTNDVSHMDLALVPA